MEKRIMMTDKLFTVEAELEATIDQKTGELLLTILKEINHPTPQPGWVVCSCGCGATRPNDGSIT